MKVCYSDKANFDLGMFAHLHPFDGIKFRRVFKLIENNSSIEFISPQNEVSKNVINAFVDPELQEYLREKEHIFRALEVPEIPLVGINFIDKRVLSPMRWGVSGTLCAAMEAMHSGFCWNLSGGFHHASRQSIEGFCIYNDIGITYQELMKFGQLGTSDRVLIIDTDAHHGNGNAHVFMENPNVEILDVYNQDIYPMTSFTRQRVNIAVPLRAGTSASVYMEKYKRALSKISGSFSLAFVVAGTDVLSCDQLGGLQLQTADVVERERLTVDFLRRKNIPTVMVTGGGYCKESAEAITRSIEACC